MQLQFQMLADVLGERLAQEALAGPTNVVGITERVLAEQLAGQANTQLAGKLIRPATAIVHASYFKNPFATLAALAETGYYTWYPEVRFATKADDSVDDIQVDTVGMVHGTITMDGQELWHRLFVKRLKTQTNHVLRLNKVEIPRAIFQSPLQRLAELGPLPQPFIANLSVGPGLAGYRLVAFDHMLTGKRFFCECARSAHQQMLESARAHAPGFIAGSWPFQVIALLQEPEYEPRMCHLCIADTEGNQAAAERYGLTFVKMLEPYVDQIALTRGLNEQTARADAQARLGVSRWVRESELYLLVKELMPENTVLREASPPWLRRMRLDVYVPELRLAFEHQGQQHFEAVPIFGGEDALRRTQERDDYKRRLCVENGVRVVDVRYDDPLSLKWLRRRIDHALKIQ